MGEERANLPNWCVTCGTRHELERRCPGELPATGEERAGWTILARTAAGVLRYQVMLAPAHELWRARVRTFPNVLWLVPGGSASLKFVDGTRLGAERQAIEFIEAHCHERGFAMQREAAALWAEHECDGHKPAPRKIRFLPVRFGLGGPSEKAGTANLSETGLFIVTDAPAEPGQQLRLVLEIEELALPLLGEVRWRRTDHQLGGVPGMGVQLMQPPRPYLRYVRNLAA